MTLKSSWILSASVWKEMNGFGIVMDSECERLEGSK